MKILLIEDNRDYSDALSQSLREAGAECVNAYDSASAITLATDSMYDLIVLDLKLPSTTGALDAKAENGHFLYAEISKLAPGTPIRILTSSDPDQFLRRLVGQGERSDIWGSGEEIPLVAYYEKEEATELIKEVKRHSATIAITNSIAINSRGIDLKLSPPQRRAIQVFVRSSNGSSCNARRLGGLSGSVVLMINVRDSNDRTISDVAGKVGFRDKLHKEISAYDRHVRHLGIGGFAHIVSKQDKGLHRMSAVFYRLANDYTNTFFDLAHRDPERAAQAISDIRKILETWGEARELKKVSAREIRQSLINDEQISTPSIHNEVENLDAIENTIISISSSCCHGDLHGSNILLNDAFQPVIIDYGDVSFGFSCLDPITLELSLVFHPDAEHSRNELSPRLHQWPSLDEYTRENRLAPVIKACRNWAYDVSGGDQAVIATAYAFTMRQLKFDTVAREVTMPLISTLAATLERS